MNESKKTGPPIHQALILLHPHLLTSFFSPSAEAPMFPNFLNTLIMHLKVGLLSKTKYLFRSALEKSAAVDHHQIVKKLFPSSKIWSKLFWNNEHFHCSPIFFAREFHKPIFCPISLVNHSPEDLDSTLDYKWICRDENRLRKSNRYISRCCCCGEVWFPPSKCIFD